MWVRMAEAEVTDDGGPSSREKSVILGAADGGDAMPGVNRTG
jgi:hypothetical protein